MRLDKFLKVSRLIKRRTVANEACDAGHVAVNGRVARASLEVKVGDRVELTFGERKTALVIEQVNEFSKKEDTNTMYKIVES